MLGVQNDMGCNKMFQVDLLPSSPKVCLTVTLTRKPVDEEDFKFKNIEKLITFMQ